MIDGAILAPGEQADDDRELSIVWARKEALLKATGDGLALDPQDGYVSSVAWLSGTGTRIVVHPDATALLNGAHL